MPELFFSNSYMVNVDIGMDANDSEIDILKLENGRVKPYKIIKGDDAGKLYASLLKLLTD